MNDELISDVRHDNSKLIKRARDLRVYRQAYNLSLAIHKLSLGFPKIEQYGLADQLRRASKSICANIAEGFVRQRYSSPEFARFLLFAEASAEEACVWLEYARDLEYISNEKFEEWDKEYLHISSMLSKLRKNL